MPDISLEYLTEAELLGLDIDPDDLIHTCPLATELRALDGGRCRSRVDLAALFAEVPA